MTKTSEERQTRRKQMKERVIIFLNGISFGEPEGE